jgi:membrane protein DedA with SNARE-associated domain
MLEGFDQYGYLGVFLTLLAAGFGVPIPEELPVLTAGIMVGHADTELRWYIMLPVVIAGVVLGDTVLYGMGRIFGRRLLDIGVIRRRLPYEKQEKIEKNFAEHGIYVLLGARMLPGIRAWVFIMAGVLKVPMAQFVLADAIYAIPLVNILFWLAYVLTDQVLLVYNQLHTIMNAYRPLIISHLVAGVVGALLYKYVFSRPVSTGEPPHVPDIIAKPAVAAAHAVERVMEKAVETVTGRHHEKPPEKLPPDGAADQEFGVHPQEPPVPAPVSENSNGPDPPGSVDSSNPATGPTPEPSDGSSPDSAADQKHEDRPPEPSTNGAVEQAETPAGKEQK